MLIKLDKNNFEKETEKGLKLVEFFAPWCGFCQKQEPILEEMDKVWIGQVNSELSPELFEKYKVTSYPTFVLFKDGEEVERFSGVHSKFDIMEILTKYMK